jgi:hypothetical protein
MKRRLVLHLGLWKTGTTTIQYLLRGNPDTLADLGVLYPKVGPDLPDHPFFHPRAPTAFIAEEVSHQFLARELAGRKERGPVALPLWTAAFRQFDESRAHTAVISYEDLSAQVSRYRFDRIAEHLKAFEVIGILYLRPQESWAVSLYSHFVRGARTSLSFREFVDSIRHRLTYSVLLDQIASQIPMDRLIVRNFDDASRTGLIQDFFQSLGLPDASLASDQDRDVRNRSLPHWAVLFLLKCIHASLPAEQFTDVRKALTRRAAGRRPIPLKPGHHLASPAERADLSAIMRADAARLGDRYGIAFTEPEAPAAAPYRPFERDDFEVIRKMITPRLAADTRAALDGL